MDSSQLISVLECKKFAAFRELAPLNDDLQEHEHILFLLNVSQLERK